VTRARVFAVVAVACVLTAGGAIASAVLRTAPGEASGRVGDALSRGPALVYRSLETANRDQVAVAPVDGGAATFAGLRCERVYFAAGSGLCVARGGGFAADYRARVFGPDGEVRHELELAGFPSRARVSRDGRLGAVTMFVTGHSYTTAGSFSTETTLIDLRTGTAIGNLEAFTVSRNGQVVTAEDVNFWVVTFAPGGDVFYATLATGGKTYLVRGSIRDRTMRTLHENVECPSLSPDGTRIAYKKRVPHRDVPWRLTVLDLATMRETPLGEMHGFDDQAEWLDDDHVLYGMEGEIRVVPADGTGAPRRFRAAGDSPAVVRG
jgi:hypothetical protein